MGLRRNALDRRDDLDPALVRKIDIEDAKIGREALQASMAAAAVPTASTTLALALPVERRGDQLAHEDVVIHHDDADQFFC